MPSAPPWIIVWDLDHTLGAFEDLMRRRAPDDPAVVRLRPGIRGVLERLLGEGFVHTVLTVATPQYARAALHGTELRELFTEVSGRGQRPKGDVDGVAARFGVEDHERAARMIFVGDHPLLDPPKDPRVVFHLESHALERPAERFEGLVLGLRERGGGSIGDGFDQILRAERPEGGPVGITSPVRCTLDGIGQVVMMREATECPKVAFADRPDPAGEPEVCSFVPPEPES